MNPYLTQKSIRSHAWRISATALCLLFAAASLVAALDLIRQKDPGTACVDLAIMVLFLYPAYRNIRHMVWSREARMAARHLMNRTEERVPLAAFLQDTGKPRLAKDLDRLIARGYLQNVRFDVQERVLILTAPDQRLLNHTMEEMECPSCGAKNQVMQGRVGRCVYCNQPLILHTDLRKKDEQ